MKEQQLKTNHQIVSSLHPSFPQTPFLGIQESAMGHHIEPGQLAKGNNLSFADPENIIGFAANSQGIISGVSYIWLRNLTSAYKDMIFVEKNNGLQLVPIAQAIQEAFSHGKNPVFEMELGGSYVDPIFRGKGVFTELFEQKKQVLNDIKNGMFHLSSTGEETPLENVFITLCSKGSYGDNPSLALLRQSSKEGFIPFTAFDSIGLPHDDIAKPRPESAPSALKAKQMQMQLIGCSANNLGPLYVLPLSQFSLTL